MSIASSKTFTLLTKSSIITPVTNPGRIPVCHKRRELANGAYRKQGSAVSFLFGLCFVFNFNLMDSLIQDLEQLKLSAFQKLQLLNLSYASKTDHIPSKSEYEKKSPSPKRHEKTVDKLSKSDNEIEKVINKLEIQRQEEVKNKVQARISKFENFTKQQEIQTQQQWVKIKQNFEEDSQQKENSIFQAMQEYDTNSSNSHAKLAQYYQNLHLRRQMQEQELKKRERQKQIMHSCIDKIKKHQQDFNSTYQQIIPTLKKCSNNDELKTRLSEEFKVLRVLPSHFEKIITKCRSEGVCEEDEKLAAHTLGLLRDLGVRMKEIVERTLQKNEELGSRPPTLPAAAVTAPPPEVTAPASEVTAPASEVTAPPSARPGPPPVATVPPSAGLGPPPVVSAPVPNSDTKIDPPINQATVSSITRYVSIANLKMYSNIIEFCDKHTASFKSLLEDASLKQFRFDCKKAINIPVNSLSGVNSEHILDKYNRLRGLLSGQDVVVSDNRINASKHPQGIPFCMDLLAKKFVLQGDLMVSSNPDSAFCYASVMSSLWNDFPIFGQLLLAYFYKSCPYLVPFCIPRQVGESDEEFYTRQGYQYNDGQIEEQDKFLKRMTGIMRLYAAMTVVKPKKGHKSTPHNIRQGWRWLSSYLKLEPQVDVTATMLHAFLDTAGFEMEARYGRTFQKLIVVLVNKFLPNCREKCSGGATTRLELLLMNYFKNKKFEKPNGYLDYSYW